MLFDVSIKMKAFVTLVRSVLLALLLAQPVAAASIVIDTFDDGVFNLSNDRSSIVTDTQTGGMLGGRRSVGISTERRSTIVTSELAAGTSVLNFDTGDGPLLGSGEGYIRLRWNSNPAMNLIGYDAFVLRFSSLEGMGQIHVGINETGFGTGSTWIPVSAPGDLKIPIGQVDVANGTLAGVASIQIVISGLSADFGLGLDEVRIIPEPSISALLLLGAVGGITRRTRKC